jgi:hypothetical protein
MHRQDALGKQVRDTVLDRLLAIRPGGVLNTGSARPAATSAVGLGFQRNTGACVVCRTIGERARLQLAAIQLSPVTECSWPMCGSPKT